MKFEIKKAVNGYVITKEDGKHLVAKSTPEVGRIIINALDDKIMEVR